MAFLTLADRFEQASKDIYSRFSPSSDQRVVVKPDTDGVFGSRSRIKNDNRSVPTVSVLRDTRRVSRFLTSSEGVLFLAKQTLLQTGNTFANTRLYNPASPLLNTVPFLHIRRNITTEAITPNAYGILQNTTVNNIASKYTIQKTIQTAIAERRSILPTIGSIAKTYLGTQLKNAIKPFPQEYSKSRPEYTVFSTYGPVVFDQQPLDQRGLPKLNLKASLKNLVISKARQTLTKVGLNAINKVLPLSLKNTPIVATIQNELNPEEGKIPSFIDAANKFRKDFYDNQLKKFKGDTTNSRIKSKYFYESDNNINDDDFDPLRQNFGAKKSKTGLKDPYNIARFTTAFQENKFSYREITKEQDKNTDIIKFIFSDIEGQTPVYFRALLSSIKENIKPEFTEQRYVGRTERFVTYSGVKRSVNLTFNIVAFSEDEREGMWSKVNYLSGLTFPKDVQNGFMVPPLFKITVGGIYDRQPCYIESLDYDFLDESITFDIDKEVPFAINVTMQLSILEKRSKFFDSPFYAITEKVDEGVRQRLGATNTTTRITSRPNTTIIPNIIASQLPVRQFPTANPAFAAGEGFQALDANGNPIP